MPAIVVGISGATRTGKGSLVEMLKAHLLGCRVLPLTKKPVNGVQRFTSSYAEDSVVVSCISQDSFFIFDKIQSDLGGNFDTPHALDHDGVLRVLTAEMEDPALTWVLIEGFMLFYDERLVDLCDIRIWLEVPMDVARKRRITTKRVDQSYFDQVIWPNHAAYEKLVFSRLLAKEQTGVIDATQSFSAIIAAADTLLSQVPVPSAGIALQAAALARKRAVKDVSPKPCGNPDCEFVAHSDPSISVDFCCDKCEARFKGEEWAWSAKKKHTAYCASKSVGNVVASQLGGYGPTMPGKKCEHPDCNYMRNPDPSVSRLYCCEKCEGLHKGAAWAAGGKRHFKSCAKIEMNDECPTRASPWLSSGKGRGASLSTVPQAAAGWCC